MCLQGPAIEVTRKDQRDKAICSRPHSTEQARGRVGELRGNTTYPGPHCLFVAKPRPEHSLNFVSVCSLNYF